MTYVQSDWNDRWCQAEATGVILKVRAELHVLPGKRNFSLTADVGVDAKNIIYG